ncbi:DUF5808 domain-containing protein [Streptomyces sp. ET3-23]|uniref:DUF1648 domain-containing protein n=1 Tax=Streptomyces sp. ET3-23 TaxID=2885643 RepID=UPI001D10342D|nr:DUF5808 domain-containing protein [Streptomyces sp. ET3-23]MCC2279304.1 DUF5808 domain-containing protein [Streptomyces sp. ET3-23]
MTALVLVQAAALLLLTGLAWAMPGLAQPSLPFGVRIPGDRAGEPVIAAAVRRYRARVLPGGLATAAAATAGTLLAGRSALALAVVPPCAVAAMVALCWSVYYRAHRTVAAAKAEHGWFDRVPQGIAVDTALRTDPERYPWAWALPAAVITAGTAVLGAVRYPALPATLVTHWDGNGRADGRAATTVLTAFTPVLLQAAVGALLAGSAVVALRSRQSLDAEHPRASAAQHRGFVRWTARGLLVLAAFVNLSLLGTALTMWGLLGHSAAQDAALTGLPVLLGVLVVVFIAVRTGAQGSRLTVDATDGAGRTAVANRDDDRYWKAGVLYVNRDDPSVFVPKRFGIGWTINFGSRGGRLVTVLLLVALLTAVLLLN